MGRRAARQPNEQPGGRSGGVLATVCDERARRQWERLMPGSSGEPRPSMLESSAESRPAMTSQSGRRDGRCGGSRGSAVRPRRPEDEAARDRATSWPRPVQQSERPPARAVGVRRETDPLGLRRHALGELTSRHALSVAGADDDIARLNDDDARRRRRRCLKRARPELRPQRNRWVRTVRFAYPPTRLI
jgi:hypothetical protein